MYVCSYSHSTSTLSWSKTEIGFVFWIVKVIGILLRDGAGDVIVVTNYRHAASLEERVWWTQKRIKQIIGVYYDMFTFGHYLAFVGVKSQILKMYSSLFAYFSGLDISKSCVYKNFIVTGTIFERFLSEKLWKCRKFQRCVAKSSVLVCWMFRTSCGMPTMQCASTAPRSAVGDSARETSATGLRRQMANWAKAFWMGQTVDTL